MDESREKKKNTKIARKDFIFNNLSLNSLQNPSSVPTCISV